MTKSGVTGGQGDGLRKTLVIYSNGERIGRIELSNGVLIGHPWAVQDMCRSKLRLAGGDAAAAYDMLNGYNNGYIEIFPTEQDPRRDDPRHRAAGSGLHGQRVMTKRLGHHPPRDEMLPGLEDFEMHASEQRQEDEDEGS